MMGYRTPNTDRIARDGMMFTDSYGEQSCTAGRAAFITGQSVFRTGLSKVGLPGAPILQWDYLVTMSAEDYLSMLDLFAYGRFVRQHLGSGRWPEFRERVAAKVAAHGLKQVEYTSRYHVGWARGDGSAARGSAHLGDHAAKGRHAVAVISPPGACARSTRSKPLASSRPPTSSAV
jgi:hypothetical protein